MTTQREPGKTDKDLIIKVENMLKKNQFQAAIEQMESSPQFDSIGIVNIRKQYADYLYKKGEHENAMSQYLHTVGKLDTSYVIRRYLTSHKIKLLIDYLEELHVRRLATNDHTTLLLNCYIKLKNREKLSMFIKKSDSPTFDIKTAVNVLRRSGFFSEALFLAKQHGLHGAYIKLHLEDDHGSIDDVIDYIEKLDDRLKAACLNRFGRLMMNKEPKRTTELIKNVFFAMKEVWDRKEFASPKQITLDRSTSILEPTIEDFFDIFLKHPLEFLYFLEYISQKSVESIDHSINNTLLHLYLLAFKREKNSDEQDALRFKINQLLRDKFGDYDIQKALISLKINNFEDGILLIYDLLGHIDLIFDHYCQKKDSENIISTCKLNGDQYQHLWVKAFWYFARNADTNGNYLFDVMDEIDRRQLMSPATLVNILTTYFVDAPLSVFRNYLTRCLNRDGAIVTENELFIQKLTVESEKIRDEIDSMMNKPRVFQSSQCSKCEDLLELPVIHFHCGHSYHIQCFESYSTDNDLDCPICLPEQDNIISSNEPEKFFDVATLIGLE